MLYNFSESYRPNLPIEELMFVASLKFQTELPSCTGARVVVNLLEKTVKLTCGSDERLYTFMELGF
jgi:hypothetical protein